MSTLSQGNTLLVSVAADQRLSASVPAGGYAQIRMASGAPGSPGDSFALQAPTLARSFGPFGVAAQIELSAIAGTLTYDVGPPPAYLLAPDGSAIVLAETVTQTNALTATGLAHTGPGYYAGLNVTAYNGGPQTITVRDSLDATGTILAVVSVTGIGVYPFAATGLRIAYDVGLHLTISGGTSRTLTALVEGF